MQTHRTSEVQNKKIKKIILLIIQYGNCITSTDLHAEVHTDTHKYKKAKKRLLKNFCFFTYTHIVLAFGETLVYIVKKVRRGMNLYSNNCFHMYTLYADQKLREVLRVVFAKHIKCI